MVAARDDNNYFAGLSGAADGIGGAGDEGCGARIRVAVGFSGNVVAEAAFSAEGASTAIAAGSALVEAVRGKHWQEASRLGVDDIIDAVESGSGAGGRKACAAPVAAGFAVDALHGAFEDALRRSRFPVAVEVSDNRVLVAMSGGVDSSTACLLEQRAGSEVIGVTLRLWSDPEAVAAGKSCCAPGAIADARSVCRRLGVGHLTFDCAEAFEQEVVGYFTREYRNGRTPNPCTRCNGSFRFPLLVELADRLGAGRIATGHYARIITGEDGNGVIARGIDAGKDQSYVLWGVDRSLLPRIGFPLGAMLKNDTRREAREAGLAVHERAESQDVCFIPDDDYRRFLRSRIEGLAAGGEIVDTSGRVIGKHDSFIDFTVGQRKGLGVSSPTPLYVVRTDARLNRVIAGTHDDLEVTEVTIGAVNSFVDRGTFASCEAQLRYNSEPVPVRVDWLDGDGEAEALLRLERPVYGVAPGQSAVLYRDDILIAGGIITGTSRAGRG